MSKSNLATVTCSLSRSDLLEFVEKHGISMCYDPQLPSSNKTTLDAPECYIPLYLSLFTIGNLHLPLNDLCLDVFEFFKCHFFLLNRFGVVCVTTFVIACKAYEGEATMPIFISFLTLSPTGNWLMFQKMPGHSIPSIYGNSMSNIPDWKLEFIFVKHTLIFYVRPGLITDFCHGHDNFAFPYPTKPFDETLWNRLRHHSFEAQTFSKHILYLAGLASSLEHAPNNPSILIDGEELALCNFIKKPSETPSFSLRPSDQPIDVGSPLVDCLKVAVDNHQVESSSVLKDKDVSSLELAVVGEGFSGQNADVAKGFKKRRSITEALEEEATVVRQVAGDNSSRTVPKKRKPKGPRRTSTRELERLKPHIKEAEHLGQRYLDLESERDFLLKEVEKVVDLSLKLKATDLEKVELMKDLLPLAVKKLFESGHSNHALGDLQQKEINFGRSQALDEVHGLGDSWYFKDVQDYNLEAEKIFVEAIEDFYKLKFPYISLLIEKAGRSFEELAAMELPSIQEAPFT
uniref:Transposase (Putative), gypsy type n=1 Tax=Tanacetum cinerariifolium TaxID=118510 RepID=A0A6L2JPE6_TANCI|nr:hypothetical protein [Tanacetum cinerariifolium]